MLFVNLKDFDVRLKHSIFATHTERETKGKKLSASLDYYLVNARTGRVYEKHLENKKTAQMVTSASARRARAWMSILCSARSWRRRPRTSPTMSRSTDWMR